MLPFPGWEQAWKDNQQRLTDFTTPEGTRRQDELARSRAAESRPASGFGGDSGLGKARSDLAWVNESVRAKKK